MLTAGSRLRHVFVRIAIPLMLLLVFSTFIPGVGAAPTSQPALAQRALELAAQNNGLSPDVLAVANSATASYPLQDKTAFSFKIMDKRDGKLYGITLDASGQELNEARLEADEQAAYVAKYGRLDPALAELLANVPKDAPIKVIVWLKQPSIVHSDRPAPKVEDSVLTSDQHFAAEAKVDAFFTQVDANLASAVAAIVAPVSNRLTKLGYTVETDKYTPTLYSQLTPKAISEVARWNEVDRIYLSPISYPDLEVARSTIRAAAVNARGFTGSGVRVAQIEVGGRIATTNPYLSGTIQNGTYVCGTASGHSTGVAGIIRSTHGSRRGIASGASLWAGGSCTGNAGQLQNRSTAAADWGARVLNLSWGSNIGRTPGINDRFYDNMVINRFRTIVKSAGNETNGCNSGTGNVTSPGLAYNVITVGNFDDKNTVDWAGDSMDSCSSYVDPASYHNDREKPEVAAPGANINSTTTSSPWTGPIGSGTSFAAPMVTGVAALMIHRNISLSVWPESIKAILMVTAVHNIEGAARLSEYDGAGGIAADRADDVAHGVNGGWGGQGYSCSTPSPLNVTRMYLYGGTRTRVAIAWDNDPSYASYASLPAADLDLQVISPSGAYVVGSASWDNTSEIVNFTPSVTGYYTLRVIKFRCSYSPRWLGWAWRRGN